ncbi:hypothetical protein M2436_005795 [Streptomyces sp. HB372]|nr:hypothetical protein [Streptomyces sp. HB372]
MLLLIRLSASRTALMMVRAPFSTRSSGTRSAWTEVATARTRNDGRPGGPAVTRQEAALSLITVSPSGM